MAAKKRTVTEIARDPNTSGEELASLFLRRGQTEEVRLLVLRNPSLKPLLVKPLFVGVGNDITDEKILWIEAIFDNEMAVFWLDDQDVSKFLLELATARLSLSVARAMHRPFGAASKEDLFFVFLDDVVFSMPRSEHAKIWLGNLTRVFAYSGDLKGEKLRQADANLMAQTLYSACKNRTSFESLLLLGRLWIKIFPGQREPSFMRWVAID